MGPNAQYDRGKMVIELKNLEFTYPSRERLERPVLNIPSFAVARGQHVFMHGPSGSGKTTLLSLLAGLQVPQKGSVSILGQDLCTLSGPERDHLRGNHVGYIFQMFNLIPYLNVRDNIALPLHINPKRALRLKESWPQAIQRLADGLGIANLLERPVTKLSVGQQQRVAAARALIGDPELVIADEPTSALDADHRRSFLDTLFAAADRAGATILFVSHDHSLAPLFKTSVALRDLGAMQSENQTSGSGRQES